MSHETNGQPVEENPYIEAYRAGPFTNKPIVQEHEKPAVEADRRTAATLGYDERDTEAFIKSRLMLRRQAEHIRQQEQLRTGERASIILNPALNREYDRQSKTAELTADEERARFCFEQWQAGKTYKEINAELKRHPEWEHFDKPANVRGPIRKWAKRIGVKPRQGQPGRRDKA